MHQNWNNLSAMEYPGRLIVIGRDRPTGRIAVVYAVTGRSASSQARKLEAKPNGVWTQPTDEETLQKGNVDLLVYPALLWFSGGVAVSNGKQTADIRKALEGVRDPVAALSASLASWEYEPDVPIHTPRISGCIVPGPKAALSLIRREEGGAPSRTFIEIPLMSGRGWLISTYDGINRDPLGSFKGDPLEVDMEEGDPLKTAEAVYDALKPRETGKDFRVATACLFIGDLSKNEYDKAIVNRHERT